MAMDKLTDKIKAQPEGSEYFSLEFFPPKTQEGFANLLPRLHRLARLKPLFTTVTWGAGGSTAARSLDLAEYLQQQLGLTTCLHLTCTNMRRAVLDDALERCRQLGVRNLLALRGDEPRDGEYDLPDAAGSTAFDDADAPPFHYAVDLVRYIREKHGDFFCIGVAAYPEGHATSPHAQGRAPEHDLPYLVEKVRAGADFIMTQLFYDSDSFLRFERMLREHDSGVFADMPIVPGLMPIQSWGILARTTKLACVTVPPTIMDRLEREKGDDAKVKATGVDVLCDIVSRIRQEHATAGMKRKRSPQGFHFYTLNLEKAVAQILERNRLVSKRAEADDSTAIDTHGDTSDGTAANGHVVPRGVPTKDRRRLSSRNSGPNNRVVVSRASASQDAPYEAPDDEAGVPREKELSRSNALAISEGEGALGREATWDDYPNGRWGDARSPAYGSIDGYGPSLHVPPLEALQLWGRPEKPKDISRIFHDYLKGSARAIPWSEESLSPETALIREQLLRLNEKGWWSVASQPAVDAARSDDAIVGWGPRVGGWVWQKPFVEFFIPSADWQILKKKLQDQGDDVTFFAGNYTGQFESSDDKTINPVTWGAFKGKEIITPTQIDCLSFRAWQDEAFALWREWQRLYPPGSPSSQLLQKTRADVWLANVIGHRYQDGGASFWQCLLD